MSEAREQAAGETNVRRLADAIREVKNGMADRDDVVVEMREVTRARLELLAAELAGVIAEVPEDDAAFDFAISSGQQPRYWIDAVAHVALGRDRRTYRFVRDTLHGRVVLAESTDPKPVADAVTRYVAERIVERQRVLEGDRPVAAPVETVAAEPAKLVTGDAAAAARLPEKPRRDRAADVLSSFALVALGLIVGAAAAVLFLREKFPVIETLF